MDIKLIKEAIKKDMDDMGLTIDRVTYHKEKGNNTLEIVLDREIVIDLEYIVKASKIINKIIDKLDLGNESYVLDIHTKEKGEGK